MRQLGLGPPATRRIQVVRLVPRQADQGVLHREGLPQQEHEQPAQTGTAGQGYVCRVYEYRYVRI